MPTYPDVTPQLLDEYCEKFRNWGRWGPDDELGTLNFITPDKIVTAAGLVKQGKVISMALPFDEKGCQTGAFGRTNPLHQMVATGTDHVAAGQSYLGLRKPYGFGHIFHDGKMWNGYDATLVTAANGAEKNGIQHMKDKVVTRGVLLDVARHRGVDYLEPGIPIYPEELDTVAAKEGVEVGEGDIVIVRTGDMGRRLREHDWGTYSAGDAPGLSFHTAPWLHEKRVAGVVSDTWGVEVRPNELEGAFQPWHLVALVNMGLLIGEIWYLEDIAADCAADGVYEFMLSAPPLVITNAVGSPVNAQAIK
jgi:kynurenine formamidase